MNIKDIHSLTLYTSEICNLQCKYCDLFQTRNSIHIIKNNDLKQAMTNGTYLKNILKILDKYNISYTDITEIQLWGEEPSLTLKEFLYLFKDFYQLDPNLNFLIFSTNGVAIDLLINFLKELDLIVHKNFVVDIQFSYDGEQTKDSRGVSYLLLQKNIKKFIKETASLQNLKIDMSFHNVITFSLINQLIKSNNIYNYWYHFSTFFTELEKEKNKNFNNNIKLLFVYPAIETPYNGTVQDGKNLTQFFIESSKILKNNTLFNKIKNLDFSYQKNLKKIINLSSFQCKQIIQQNNYSEKSHFGCGPLFNSLKIRYNGEFLYCHHLLHEIDEKEIELIQDKHKKEIIKEQKRNNFIPNLILNNDEEIKKYIYKWKIGSFNNSFSYIYSTYMNFAIILALNNQIDSSYLLNPDKLIKHIYFLCFLMKCWNENISQTGSLFGITLGYLRIMLNGFLEEIEKSIKKEEDCINEIKL